MKDSQPVLTPEQLAVIQLVLDERIRGIQPSSLTPMSRVELPTIPTQHPQYLPVSHLQYQQLPHSQQPIYLAVNVNNDVRSEPKQYHSEQRDEKRLDNYQDSSSGLFCALCAGLVLMALVGLSATHR